jgi:hypothetical protein
MLSSYSSYINSYLLGRGKGNPPTPGEHHFVAAYLVPKLFKINGKVPDYINPDGTKSILGDVVYYQDGKHHFGIEVKLGTVRLTRQEFNTWIVGDSQNKWPDLFIGVGNAGLGLTTWGKFRDAYVKAVRAKNRNWKPKEIAEGYGPMKSVDVLLQHLPSNAWFPYAPSAEEAEGYESRFTQTLRDYIDVWTPRQRQEADR